MANFYKVQQLTEQSTTSTTFVTITGTTLTFTPVDVGQTWVIFASGTIRSSSTVEQSMELALYINGTQKDICSHQVSSTSAANGGGFLFFDRITGTTSLQTIDLRLRAITGTARAGTLRVVAAMIPDGADFQYSESLGQVQTTGYGISIHSLTFTPSSTGEYFFMGSAKIRESPGAGGAQITFAETNNSTYHPFAPTNIAHTNSMACWNPATYIWRETINGGSPVTANTYFGSSDNGVNPSQHIYRKMMAFRLDAWDAVQYDFSPAQQTTTSTSYQTKNSVTLTTPPAASDYLSIQLSRISGDSTSGTTQKSGRFTIVGITNLTTNHTTTGDNTATNGYHHTAALVDTRNSGLSFAYANQWRSSDATNVHIAESSIVVLRYAVIPPSNQYQMII